MHKQHTIAFCLHCIIIRWLSRCDGGRQTLLIRLAFLLTLLCAGAVTASPAFLGSRLFYLIHSRPGPDLSYGKRSQSLTSHTIFFTLPAASSRFRTGIAKRCQAIASVEKWPLSGGHVRGVLCHFRDDVSLYGSVVPRAATILGAALSDRHAQDFTGDGASNRFASAHSLTGRTSHRFMVRAEFLSPLRETAQSGLFRLIEKGDVLHAAAPDAAAPAMPAPERGTDSSAALLKRLRSLTGCSVVACKEALQNSQGDLQAAVDCLRRKGLAVTAGRATTDSPQRLQTDGVVAVAPWRASRDREGTIQQSRRKRQSSAAGVSNQKHEGEVAVKLSCSTDFVARNKRITQFARRAAALLAEHLQQVGVQDILTTEATGTAAVHGKNHDDSDPLWAAKGGQQPHSAAPPVPPKFTGRVVVARGTTLVKRLLNLPWSPGEEAAARVDGAADLVTETIVTPNFFQAQQQLKEAASLESHSAPQVLEKKKVISQRLKKKPGPAASFCTTSQHVLKAAHTTIQDELYYISSLVKEPLCITDAVAVETPVRLGVVASYIHGLLDKQVGTVAVLAALTANQEVNERSAEPSQQLTANAHPAAVEGMQHRRRDSEPLRPQVQELQQVGEARQRKRSTKTKLVSVPPLQRSAALDALQQGTEDSREIAADYELADRMRTLAESVCMQIVAGKPLAVDERSLERGLLKKVEDIYRAQAETSGKPSAIVERIVAGRVKKWLKEVLLSNQTWLLDDSGMTVQQKLSEFAAQQHSKAVPRIETFVKVQVH